MKIRWSFGALLLAVRCGCEGGGTDEGAAEDVGGSRHGASHLSRDGRAGIFGVLLQRERVLEG